VPSESTVANGDAAIVVASVSIQTIGYAVISLDCALADPISSNLLWACFDILV